MEVTVMYQSVTFVNVTIGLGRKVFSLVSWRAYGGGCRFFTIPVFA